MNPLGDGVPHTRRPVQVAPLPFGLVLVIIDLAITPFQITMVQTHLRFRYAWTLARQLPGLAPSISAF